MSGIEEYKFLLESVEARAREIVRTEELTPIAFSVSRPDSGLDISIMPLPMSLGKDLVASLLRKALAEQQAIAVAVAMEIWTLPPDAAAKFFAETQGHGSIADHPQRISAFSVSLETLEGNWVAMSNITGEFPHRTFAPLKFLAPAKTEGRFTGLLPIPHVRH